MPARSKSQQRLMAWVHAYKSGKTKDVPDKIKQVAKHISDSDAREFAKTKHDDLPEKKASYIDDYFIRGFVQRMSELDPAFLRTHRIASSVPEDR